MDKQIQKITSQINDFTIQNSEELEAFRIQFLGSKNCIKELFKALKSVPNEKKKDTGLAINALKELANKKFETLSNTIKSSHNSKQNQTIDLSAPGPTIKIGSTHPISLVQKEVVDLFKSIGFTVSSAQEIENEWHVFSALNVPEDHPSRDMQDTFFINNSTALLRSHTSSVQIRVMESEKPPIRTISPGRVFRNETISARSHSFFHQIEGLYVNKGVSFSDLKSTLLYFAKTYFGKSVSIRLRPSFFPFTEPSAEVDISCTVCNTKGCNLCKYTGYIEILGCGMVDPNVLTNCNIDPEVYSGFAFGMGIERIAMLKYKIKDIRLFSQGDSRFLSQFSNQTP